MSIEDTNFEFQSQDDSEGKSQTSSFSFMEDIKTQDFSTGGFSQTSQNFDSNSQLWKDSYSDFDLQSITESFSQGAKLKFEEEDELKFDFKELPEHSCRFFLFLKLKIKLLRNIRHLNGYKMQHL
jgi:hypothetical protein